MDASGKADIVIGKPLYRSNMLESLQEAKRLIAQRIAMDAAAMRTVQLTGR